jgi:hypothetical protein
MALEDRLDVAARFGAMMLVFFYVCGFLVVTFNCSTYGILSFGLFRSKVLSAGIAFSIFLAIPLLGYAGVFGLKNRSAWAEWTGGLLATEQTNPPPSFAVRGTSFVMFSLVNVYLLRWYVFGDHDRSAWVLLINVGFAAVFATIQTFSHWFARHVLIRALVCLFAVVAALVTLELFHRHQSLLLVAWFLVVGWFANEAAPFVTKPKELHKASLVWTLINCVAIFSLFSYYLYPELRPSFGGGKPVHAEFHFTSVSPIDQSNKTDLWLLDEVDSGYYVLKAREDRKAIYISKSLVSAIFFEPDEVQTN